MDAGRTERERRCCSSHYYHIFHTRPRASRSPRGPPFQPLLCLQTTKAILLIDVAVALLLHPVLENHGGAENEDEVDANDTKGGSEDLVEVPVGE
jgi:hypothetical protein